jgi:hypothetical protein
MHIDLDMLVNTDPPMTVERHILAAIRRGVYPWVAAESAGLSRQQFQAWLRSKEPRYRTFAVEVRKARAQARLKAELTLFENEPRTWLKSGPGREARDAPGWSKEVAARVGDESPSVHPLADPDWQVLFRKVLDALAPYPEARAALAQLLSAQSQADAQEE